MALKIQGEDDNLGTGDFIDFGRPFGIPARAISLMIGEICDRAEDWLGRIVEIGFDEKQTVALQKEVQERIRRLRR